MLKKRAHLAEGVGGEVDGGNFVELLDGTRVDVGGLQHASAEAALAQRALAHCVERHQLVLVVGRPHVHHHLLAAHKRPLVLHNRTSLAQVLLQQSVPLAFYMTFWQPQALSYSSSWVGYWPQETSAESLALRSLDFGCVATNRS